MPRVDYQIGDRLKKLRKHRGLSQAQFALVLRVGKSHISKIEKGVNQPSAQLLQAICREFGVKEDWLVYGDTTLAHKDGFSDDELERLEMGGSDLSQGALFRLLADYWVTLIEMTNQIARLHDDVEKIGEPSELLLGEKRRVVSVLVGLGNAINSLFRNLEASGAGRKNKKITDDNDALKRLTEGL